jgi:drug/metabolite transporter (DMT)-like permease
MSWYTLATISALIFGANALLIKHVNSNGITIPIIMFFLYLVGAVTTVFYSYVNNYKFFEFSKLTIFLILIGLFSTIGMLTQIRAINLAPNAGYAVAIISAQTIVTALGAYLIFGASLSVMKFTGILVTLLGVFIISYSK